MMSLKVAMKMMSLVVISGAIAEAVINVPEAVINVPKPGPDCYKTVEQVCLDQLQRATCDTNGIPFYSILTSSCAFDIGHTIGDPCFFDVLAPEAGKRCGLDSKTLRSKAIDIWRYCLDGSKPAGKVMFGH